MGCIKTGGSELYLALKSQFANSCMSQYYLNEYTKQTMFSTIKLETVTKV